MPRRSAQPRLLPVWGWAPIPSRRGTVTTAKIADGAEVSRAHQGHQVIEVVDAVFDRRRRQQEHEARPEGTHQLG